MKFILGLMSMLFTWQTFAQGKEIPACLKKKIDKNSNLLELYLAEIEGQQLYFFENPPQKGTDRILTTIFYDENGKEANRSNRKTKRIQVFQNIGNNMGKEKFYCGEYY